MGRFCAIKAQLELELKLCSSVGAALYGKFAIPNDQRKIEEFSNSPGTITLLSYNIRCLLVDQDVTF